MCRSPVLNGSSEIQCFECADAIKICNRIMFIFYPGMPHMYMLAKQNETKAAILTA